MMIINTYRAPLIQHPLPLWGRVRVGDRGGSTIGGDCVHGRIRPPSPSQREGGQVEIA